jgi:hypothetical protein
MSLIEYATGDYNDFFIADDSYPISFPCCVCKNRFKNDTDLPCRFCCHNDNQQKSFNCSLCDELQPGDPFNDSHTIAQGTPAQISYVCATCFKTIRESFGGCPNWDADEQECAD